MKSSVIDILNAQLGSQWRSKKFVIAASGGGDSMSLLHLFSSENCNIIAAHINYGLRENDSDLDQETVTQFCKKNKVTLETLHPNTKEHCELNKVGIQEGAREIRYNWFEHLLQKHTADYIVTAHHQEDVIETFIINLQRGSGIKGLHPLAVLNGNKLRPLSSTSKLSIQAYLLDNNVAFREDLSNSKNDYLRNSIRNSVLPELYNKLPKLKTGITATIQNLRLDSSYLFKQLEKEKLEVFIPNEVGGTIVNYSSLHTRLLLHIIAEFGFHFNQLEQLLLSNITGKTFISKTHQIVINRDDLLIEKLALDDSESSIEITDYGTYHFNKTTFIVSRSDHPLWDNSKVGLFPCEQLTFPFTIRKWKSGDSFIPYGMKGRKKVSDYLIDCKVSTTDKKQIAVLEHQDKIAWLIGLRISENYKSDATITSWVSIEILP